MWVLLEVTAWWFSPLWIFVPIGFMVLMMVTGGGVVAGCLVSDRVRQRVSGLCVRMMVRMMEHMPDE